MDLCEFEANLIYRVSARIARETTTTEKNPALKKTNKQINKQIKTEEWRLKYSEVYLEY